MRTWQNRFRGLAILAALAALAFGLRALGHLDRPAPRIWAVEGEGGETILFVIEEMDRKDRMIPRDIRLLLSKVHIELDPDRWVLQLPGGAQRLLPGNWPVVLIRARGELEPHPLLLNADQLHELLLRVERDGYPGIRLALTGFDPRLKSFFDRQ